MKKEKNIINIGEDFKRKKSIINNFNNGYLCDFKTLEECYNNCSTTKRYIYNKYNEMIHKNCDNVLNYGIRSYNSMIIVLHAIIIKKNIKYYLLITPSYNWYIEMD